MTRRAGSLPEVNAPLCILAFDHRTSLMRSFFGVEGEPGPEEAARARSAKEVVTQGLLLAIEEGLVPRGSAAALVDATYGSRAIGALKEAGVPVAVPVEASGRDELAFEHEDWRERLAAIDPAWAKVLVRYNPEADRGLNRRQLERLAQLHAECGSTGRPMMLELLVPSGAGRGGPAYDLEVRPGLVVRAVVDIRDAGITPSLWKIEGFERPEHYREVAAVAREPWVVLGRGQDASAVERWLRAASGVEGNAGFAIGRSIWWEPLRAYFDGDGTDEARRAAASKISDSYARFCRVLTDPRVT